MLIEGNNLSCSFNNSERPLFEQVDIVLENKLQFLVGRNGIGKSQLAAILAKKKIPSTGNVKHFCSVGYLSQQLDAFGGTGADCLGISALLKAKEAISAGEGTGHDFDLLEGNWDIEVVIEKRLEEGSLSSRVLNQYCDELSGGERTRLSLLALKYSNHDFLILDEPSNHLDREGRIWFLQWIKDFQNCLIVSHDRFLLKHSDIIFELSEMGVQRFRGGWETYMDSRAQLLLGAERQETLLRKEYQQAKRTQQRSVEKTESSSSKGRRRRDGSNQSKIVLDFNKSNNERTQSRTTRLNKERVMRSEDELRKAKELLANVTPLSFVVAPPVPTTGYLVYAEDMVLPYGYTKPISLQIHNQDRLAITGNNGSGKSTLLNVLAGKTKAKHGECKVTISCALLDQTFSLLDTGLSALDNFMKLAPDWPEHKYRTVLAQLRLSKDFALYPVSWLSGGERLKVALAALFSGPSSPSLLLLDEPDNHLDLEAKGLLEQALHEYKGGLVVVSHDEEFIENIGVNRSIDMGRSE